MGVADGRTDELETPFYEVLAQRVGLGRACREFRKGMPGVVSGLPAHESPEVSVKTPELVLELQKRPCIVDRRLDLAPVADDPRVIQ
jgi:hypothetical protein